MASRDGYFPPESVIRRVGNDPLVPLLGGGAAVLLQVAHPLVAAGVAAHSDFDRNLWRRLIRTLRPLYLVIYGDRREAEAAAAEVRAVHARVEGRTRETLGPFAAGTPYSASDPDLMMWVHATLVETSLAVYHRFVERLTPVEQESYYREMSIVGQLFGLPAQVVPPTLAQFRDYFGDQVSGPEIPVTPPAEAVARVVLAARVPAPLRLTLPSHRLATAGLLPPRLRGEYGLRWGRVHAAALPVAVRSMRTIALPLARIADRVTRSAPLRRGNAAIGSA